MKRYTVYVTPAAWKEIRKLPGHVRQRIRRTVDDLADESRPDNSRELQIENLSYELRRLRIDRWRIVYAVTESDGIVDVLAIRKRPPYDYGDLAELLAKLN